jgi:hypothetical protein
MNELNSAVAGCLEVCGRCRTIVAGLSSAEGDGLRIYPQLGPHLRHCLDHMVTLLRGFETGTIDYDDRDRDARLETDPREFLATLTGAEEGLRQLASSDLGRPVKVLQQAAPGIAPTPVDSTLERELVFLSSHTIHHLALMLYLARTAGLDLPVELGVAFSTASYQADAGAPAG